MVETVLTYGCEVWAMREDDKRKLTAVEMDYLRRSARRSRLERIRNEQIRREMSAEETVIERIEKKSLKWFGHLLRMEETRWPKRIFQWTPPGKQKRGRPHRSCRGRLGRRRRGDLRRFGGLGLRQARPQLGLERGGVVSALPVHAPGQRRDQQGMHQERQRKRAQRALVARRGKFEAFGGEGHGVAGAKGVGWRAGGPVTWRSAPTGRPGRRPPFAARPSPAPRFRTGCPCRR